MIWDRYDDAMNDLDDHVDRAHRQIRGWERKLNAAGIDPGPWNQPDHRGQHTSFQGPHDTYLDRQSELRAAEARLQEVVRMWNEHVARGEGGVKLVAAPKETPNRAAATPAPDATEFPEAESAPGPATRFVPSWFWMLYAVSVVSAFAIGLLIGLMKK